MLDFPKSILIKFVFGKSDSYQVLGYHTKIGRQTAENMTSLAEVAECQIKLATIFHKPLRYIPFICLYARTQYFRANLESFHPWSVLL